MKVQPVPSWLIKVIVATAIPGIACIGLYGIDFSQDASGARALMTIAAYPMLLISTAGAFLSLSAQRRNRRAPWMWIACIASSIVVLIGSRI